MSLANLTVSTMTICSRWIGDAASHAKLESAILAIPTTHEDSAASGVVKRKSKSDDKVQVPTGLEWSGEQVYVTLRRACSRSSKGSGEVIRGNFRNCVQLSSTNYGVKLFRSGAVSAYGFRDLETFHSFTRAVLKLLSDGASLDADKTAVALAIVDTRIPADAPLHLRALAQKCASRTLDGEHIEFSPEEFAGIKIKLPHPSVPNKQVSVTVRAKGSVKFYIGTPGPDVKAVADAVKGSVLRIMNLE